MRSCVQSCWWDFSSANSRSTCYKSFCIESISEISRVGFTPWGTDDPRPTPDNYYQASNKLSGIKRPELSDPRNWFPSIIAFKFLFTREKSKKFRSTIRRKKLSRAKWHNRGPKIWKMLSRPNILNLSLKQDYQRRRLQFFGNMKELKGKKWLERYAKTLANTPDKSHILTNDQIDRHLIPVLAFLYLCSHADRNNLGNAKVEGMNSDLGLVGNQYNIASTLFFVPYIIFGTTMPRTNV